MKVSSYSSELLSHAGFSKGDVFDHSSFEYQEAPGEPDRCQVGWPSWQSEKLYRELLEASAISFLA